MRRTVFFSLALLICISAFAQTEVNVKLSSGNLDLQQFLVQKADPNNATESIPTVLNQRFPFLSNLNQVIPLKQNETLENIFTLTLSGQNVQQVISDLNQSGAFEFVEENRSLSLHHLNYQPNDDSLSRQWFHNYIQTPEAWDLTQGSNSIKIGFIDTGIDFNHPEFDGQLYINSQEDLNNNGTLEAWPDTTQRGGVYGDLNGIDEDGNGYTDDVVGYDFVDQPRSPFGGDYLFDDPNPADDNGHGTAIAGIIGAKADNQIGGAGVAPGCLMVPIRAFAANGSGEDDDVARAIVYAADNGIKILNFSFGDIYPSLIMHEAIKYAYDKDVIMIASAGNGTGDELHYPSGFDEVISISASALNTTTGREFLWPLSSYGLTVDLCAPGSRIFTTSLIDTSGTGQIRQYMTTQGTSTSAPMVAGTVGLLFSLKGYRTPSQVRGLLTSNADDISDEGWDHLTGAGRLNTLKVLQAVGASNVKISSPQHDRGSNKDSVYIVGTVLDPEFEKYHIEWQYGLADTNTWFPIVSNQAYQTKDDTLAMWDLTQIPSDLDPADFPADWDGQTLPEGEYTLRIRIEKTNGFTSEDRVRFIRDKTTPIIKIKEATPVWDNEIRKVMIIFRSSDQGLTTLKYRRQGSGNYKSISFDRNTRNGDFLLASPEISSGDYEFFIEMENLAGLIGQSEMGTFSFQSKFINRTGYQKLDYSLPMGRFVEKVVDFDGDGLKEVVLNEYSANLGFGRMVAYEFNGSFFVKTDSSTIKPILIPKDIADTDNDGLMEILASVNDSSYIFEQPNDKAFPTEVIFSSLGDSLRASQFGDTDGDGQLEILMKDDVDFHVFDQNGGDFMEVAVLEDNSPNYMGGIRPRALVDDFDGDGRPETIYGDFDGDLIGYEHSSGNSYQPIFLDTTSLTKSGNYLTKGDFDGDGQLEFFVATHTSPLRNPDFEYDPTHIRLRIFKSNGNDSYEVVWEDFLYDIDSETYNGATAGNLDPDAADELVFTTFPRTYILDYNGSEYEFDWFLYGTLATHHIIADFNGNGVNELALGRGDSTFFYEKNVSYTGPKPVTSLRGSVTGPNSVSLTWQASGNATGYEIWQVKDPLKNDLALVVGPITETKFEAINLSEDTLYLFVLRALNPSLTPTESGFGNAIFLTPHALPKVDSLAAISANRLEVFFSQPVEGREEDKSRFTLNQEQTPLSIIGTGPEGKKLIMSFRKVFEEGWNQLSIDTTFRDAGLAYLDPSSKSKNFFYENKDEESLYLTHWEAEGDKTGLLYFNFPLDDESALDTANYSISPYGSIKSVEWGSDDMDAIRVTIDKAKFGALGYPISIQVENVCAINLVCIDDEGNTATFSSHKEDLSEVYVYPNPARPHELFEGVRFANLTKQAKIRVMTVSGRFVNELEETDGDGGLEWDLRDQANVRVKPGVYIYHVWTEKDGVEDFIGKFSVVE